MSDGGPEFDDSRCDQLESAFAQLAVGPRRCLTMLEADELAAQDVGAASDAVRKARCHLEECASCRDMYDLLRRNAESVARSVSVKVVEAAVTAERAL